MDVQLDASVARDRAVVEVEQLPGAVHIERGVELQRAGRILRVEDDVYCRQSGSERPVH